MACLGPSMIACLRASALMEAGPFVNWTEPRVGFISRAAMRSRVVFPAPLGPSSATNSPARISRETPRSAAREPKRFSTFWNETPIRAGAGGVCVADRGNARRLALHQVAERFFYAGAFAGVIVFADGAGLAAEFEAEHIIFEVVEAALNLLVNIGDGFYCAAQRSR